MVLEPNTHSRHYGNMSVESRVHIMLAASVFTEQVHPRTFDQLNFSVSYCTEFKFCMRSPCTYEYAIKLIWKNLL
jgi:hypothetical protein